MLEYLITGFIVLVLIVTTFIFLIVVPKHKYYFDSNIYPDLSNLTFDEAYNSIRKECELIQDTFIIYSNKQVNHDNIKQIPNIYSLLRTIPDIRNAFITVLKPKTKTTRHKGSADLANNTLRCVLPLEISGTKKTGVWVDGEKKFYTDKEWIVYDDSRENNSFNSERFNVTKILVIDIDRPKDIPFGVSEKNTNRLL
jgi:hypothetical protein